jgi:transcriptional regulator with XRE-family HTH domain
VLILGVLRLFLRVVGKFKQKQILRHRKIIGETIRHYRKQAGRTQEKLAEQVDLNWKYIGEVERGEKIISIEALLRIAKTVKVPASDFFRDL